MPSLPGLPVDLLLVLAEHLPLEDLKQLASVNSVFRNQLASNVFHTVKVRNDAECVDAAREIGRKYGDCIRAMSLVEHANVFEEEEGFAYPPPVGQRSREPEVPWGPRGRRLLLPGVRAILEGEIFPKVDAVSVSFKHEFGFMWSCICDPGCCAQRDRSAVNFHYDEPDEYMRREEPRWKWRAMMAEVWFALAKNLRLRHIAISPLVSKSTTAFLAPAFKSMLAQLESFHIATLDIEGKGHGAFLSRMDDFFFRSLSSLRMLKIEFPYIVDLSASVRATDSLKPHVLPKLEHLELRKSFVGKELILFLHSHAGKLRTLVLDSCMCSPNSEFRNWPGPATNGDFIKWAHIFKSLRQTSVALTRVDITPRDGFDHPALEERYGCTQWWENRHGDWNNLEEPAEVTVVRQKLKNDPRLWGFEYYERTQEQDKPSHPAGHGLGIEEFERGDDQREFDLLQEVLSARRSLRR